MKYPILKIDTLAINKGAIKLYRKVDYNNISKNIRLREDFVPLLAYTGERGRSPDTSYASASIAGHTHFDRKLSARIVID